MRFAVAPAAPLALRTYSKAGTVDKKQRGNAAALLRRLNRYSTLATVDLSILST